MEKKFDKYCLKRDHKTGYVLVEDGKPIFDELLKGGCPLEQKHANILNKSWKQTGIYYNEVKEKKIDPIEKSEERIALEKEATDLGIRFRENIGDEKLKLKINEIKSLIGNECDIDSLKANRKWIYKLDIRPSGRWLYDTAGIISKLNYQLNPSFRINDNNKLLKILLSK